MLAFQYLEWRGACLIGAAHANEFTLRRWSNILNRVEKCVKSRTESPETIVRTYQLANEKALTMAIAFDSLGYVKRLRNNGVDQRHAEAARDFIMSELVTKSDLAAA